MGVAAKSDNGVGVVKQTSQRSLLFRQNVNRTEEEWVHFLDGYRKALIEFDMNKFGDDWHTAEDIVEEIFLNIVGEPRITALRPQDETRREIAAGFLFIDSAQSLNTRRWQLPAPFLHSEKSWNA